MREAPIHITELDEEGVHVPAWGRFNHAGELVYVIATLPNGQARTWTREAVESAEIFAGRIIRDIVESVRGQCVGVLVA
jgi:hypothetical protein